MEPGLNSKPVSYGTTNHPTLGMRGAVRPDYSVTLHSEALLIQNMTCSSYLGVTIQRHVGAWCFDDASLRENAQEGLCSRSPPMIPVAQGNSSPPPPPWDDSSMVLEELCTFFS